ncbi:MAG: adenine deaminase C-terminal domain-containing protein [Thermodesulfobacteriota bacterium]
MESGRDMRRLVDTALGRRAADLVVQNGDLMDVYTGRMLPGRSIAITDGWIAYVGSDAEHTVGPETRVIDAGGRVVCPGFMDAHTHLINYFNMPEFLSYAIPSGVTTLVTELECYGFILGAEGVRIFLDQIESSPIKIYALVPPMISLSPAVRPLMIRPEQLAGLFEDPRVMGLGESFWQGTILTPDQRVLDLISETRKHRKSVQGHAAGAFDQKLAAYVAIGVESCHEAISTEDVLNRLEMGLYAMIREGDIRRDLEIILPLRDKIDFRRVILVTDGTNPNLLMQNGYLQDVVQKAIDLGVEPMDAIRMVTLNPAEHLGLATLTGGIAPGRHGDLLILPDARTMKPQWVISKGRVVARDGQVTVTLPAAQYPEQLMNTVRADPVSSGDLRISQSLADADGKVRTLDIQPGGLVAREGRARPKVVSGDLAADPENDLLKIFFMERLSGQGDSFTGFVRGWGQKQGAVATTLCWDAGGIMGIGENDADLTAAVNHLIDIQGGTAVFVDGDLILEIPLSVGGYVSPLNMAELAERLSRFQKRITSLGTRLDFAHLALSVLTTPAIPFIRMTEKGYYRFRESDVVGLGES